MRQSQNSYLHCFSYRHLIFRAILSLDFNKLNQLKWLLIGQVILRSHIILLRQLDFWIVYSYWLGSRTTAVLFDPRTNHQSTRVPLFVDDLGKPMQREKTDPFEGQTKMLLFEMPVYNCFVIHLHFFKTFLIHSFLSHIHLMFSISLSVKSDDASTLWRQFHVTY